LPTKKKPFVFECSDGKVRQTALGLDFEWQLQTDDDRKALAAVAALRWSGERSHLAVSQKKPGGGDDDDEDEDEEGRVDEEAEEEEADWGGGGGGRGGSSGSRSAAAAADESEGAAAPWAWLREAEDADHADDDWDPTTCAWADLWAALQRRGWRDDHHYEGPVMTRELEGAAPLGEAECAWASAFFVRVTGWTLVQPRAVASSGGVGGGGVACFLMPRPELGEPRAFSCEADVRLFLRSFPELLAEQRQPAPGADEDEEAARKPLSKAAVRRAKAARAQDKAAGKRSGRRAAAAASGEQHERPATLGDEGKGDESENEAVVQGKSGSESEDAEGDVASGSEDDDDDADEVWAEVDLAQSLFDSSRHGSAADALGYMVKKYGFFLPEAE
jgi:hypothetical protein